MLKINTHGGYNDQLQSNFYKLNHHYPENNFNLKKLQVKEAKPDRISRTASAMLQHIETSSNRSSNYRSSTVCRYVMTKITNCKIARY